MNILKRIILKICRPILRRMNLIKMNRLGIQFFLPNYIFFDNFNFPDARPRALTRSDALVVGSLTCNVENFVIVRQRDVAALGARASC
jgi:hypothetical protein